MSREELEKLNTVGDVLDLLQQKISDPGTEMGMLAGSVNLVGSTFADALPRRGFIP